MKKRDRKRGNLLKRGRERELLPGDCSPLEDCFPIKIQILILNDRHTLYCQVTITVSISLPASFSDWQVHENTQRTTQLSPLLSPTMRSVQKKKTRDPV